MAVTTLTNGDTNTIASPEYNLLPKNASPRYAIQLIDSSDYSWELDSNSNSEYVISVLGFWGFHDRYAQRDWTLATAVNDATHITTTENPITDDLGTAVAAGKIFKIDNEIMVCSSSNATTITAVARGDNGSTAATHQDDASVYIWNPPHDIRLACLEIAEAAYMRRFGTNTTGVATITAAGVVITPEEIPANAKRIIDSYTRVVWH